MDLSDLRFARGLSHSPPAVHRDVEKSFASPGTAQRHKMSTPSHRRHFGLNNSSSKAREVSMDGGLRDVQLALRRARDAKRKRAERTDDETGVSKQCFCTALCIGLLADYDMRAGVAWLECSHRRGHSCKDDVQMDIVLQRLRNIFLEADLDALDALRDPERTSLPPSAFACAARFAQEYRLGMWVRERNLAGASVRTPFLIDEFQKKLESSPPPVQLRAVPEMADDKGRQWAVRWRRSQGAVFGKIRTQEPITTAESREKARGGGQGALVAPLLPGFSNLQKRHSRITIPSTRGRDFHGKRGAFFGPRFGTMCNIYTGFL